MRQITIISLIGLLLLVGCDRYLDSKLPNDPEPVELVAPSSLAVTLDDQALNLSWQYVDSSAGYWFRIYLSDSLQGDYSLFDSTTTFSYRFDNLVLNRQYFLALAAVSGGVEGRRSNRVSAFLGPLSMVIEDGHLFTNQTEVQIRLNTTPGVTHMMLSEDSLMADAVYETFTPNLTFELSAGEGLKKVFASLIFQDGLRTGTPLSDQITLDQRTSIDSVYYLPAQTFSAGDTILFHLVTNELSGEASVAIEGIATISLYDDGVAPDQTLDDGTYTGKLIVNSSLFLTDASYIGTFTDRAGNSDQRSALVPLNVFSTPLAPQLIQAEAVSSWEVSLAWSESSDADFASYRIYRSVAPTPDNSGLALDIRLIQSQTTYTDTTVMADTKYYYRVYAYSNNGLSAGSNIDSALTMSNDPPSAVILAGTIVDTLSIRLSWSTSPDLDFESYRIYRDLSSMADTADGTMIEYISTSDRTSYTDYAPVDTTYYYRVYVFDRQGAMAASDEIAIKR